MDIKIVNIEDLRGVVIERYHQLNGVYDYLNDKGLGELEALKAIYWHTSFVSSLRELVGATDGLEKLAAVDGKSPTYYSTIRKVIVAVNRAIGSNLRK